MDTAKPLDKFVSIEDIIYTARSRGSHFFDPDARRYFRSRILSDVYGGRFFVTSEQFRDVWGSVEPRRYTVREVISTQDSFTINAIEFQAFASANEAKAAAKKLAEEGKKK